LTQGNPAAAHPVSQCRAGNGNASTGKDTVRAVQPQVIGILGHQDMRQQAVGWNALVDDLGRYRRLSQYFTLITDPFPCQIHPK
jgi:hypothetical protein